MKNVFLEIFFFMAATFILFGKVLSKIYYLNLTKYFYFKGIQIEHKSYIVC